MCGGRGDEAANEVGSTPVIVAVGDGAEQLAQEHQLHAIAPAVIQ
jgi:hypothetical protein